MGHEGEDPSRRRRRRRRRYFRLVSLLLGLSPFIVAELGFRLLGWGGPGVHADPFVGFSAIHPLFVLDESGTRYEIPPARQTFFRPESFRAVKAPDEFRIFCLGGSTVQGRPFAIETSFTTWLELGLRAADPNRRWEVVNCGGVSYATYRLVPILEEVLRHRPDLIILYTGHNEFLEDRTYGHIKHRPALATRALEIAFQLRTFVLAHRLYLRLAGGSADEAPAGRPILGADVDAVLDRRGGLDRYHRDEGWRRGVVEHFRYNLVRMVHTARDRGVPMILVNPASNLRDCPPFKAEHREDLTEEERGRLEGLRKEAARHYKTDPVRSLELLREAAALDDQHAGVSYALGKCHDVMGRFSEAHRAYLRAKELDVCPLRILESMSGIILTTARRTGTPVVDVERLFEGLSDGGIPGTNLLLDHVHPTILGHQRIADALAGELVRLGVVRPGPEWKRTRDRSYREHTASLDDAYYLIGMNRLRALRGWTQGRAGKLPGVE